MSYAARAALREVKNVAKGYTEIQARVREATSNDPGPCNSELMRQIAAATHYDQQFVEIMIIMEKRLNDDGRNWRHVYKALVLLEYMILAGSDRVLQYARDNLYVVKTLREFQYRDESGVDHGQSVRQKALKVTELLSNPELLRQERATRRDLDDRVGGHASGTYPPPSAYGRSDSPYPPSSASGVGSGADPAAAREEEMMRRAIEESLKTAERERSVRSGYGSVGRSQSVPRNVPSSTGNATDISEEEQIQRAIELSMREEEERQRRRGGTSTTYGSSGGGANGSNKAGALIDLLGGDEHPIVAPQATGFSGSIVSHPTGATDPFALPAGNPFTQLSAQPTGAVYVPAQATGVTDIFASAAQAPPAIPPMPTGYMGMQPTGNPFGAQAPMPTGSPFAAGGMGVGMQATGASGPFAATGIAAQSTGFGSVGMQGTGSIGGAGFNPFASAGGLGGPARPASTPPVASKPMVDLDNLSSAPNRNPFALTNHSTGASQPGGGFNWSGQSEQPKLSLAEIAVQRQQQQAPLGMAMTGPAGMTQQPQPMPFGAQPTGPFGAQQPVGPFGGGMMVQQTGPAAFGGQQQQQQQQGGSSNNPFF